MATEPRRGATVPRELLENNRLVSTGFSTAGRGWPASGKDGGVLSFVLSLLRGAPVFPVRWPARAPAVGSAIAIFLVVAAWRNTETLLLSIPALLAGSPAG